MRRILAGFTAFMAVTGTVLVLPVYAAPGPESEPVATSAAEIAMGSVETPAAAADVQEGTTEPVAGVPASAPVLTVLETDADPFSMVGVTWTHDPAVTDTVVKVRVTDEVGTWGDWSEVTVEDAEQEEDTDSGRRLRGGTSPLWTGPSTGVEVELVTRGGAQPADVELNLIDPGESDADSALGAPEITDTAHAAGTMPPVYSRAQWGADESIRTWNPEYPSTIKAATIHHTADSTGYTADQVPAIMRSIYRYHTVGRGWGDVGYNVIVDKFGRIFEGRYGGLASTVVGAHAGGFNSYTFGVSMLGNFESDPTTPAMINSVSEIIAWKFSLYGVNPRGTTTLVSGGSGTARYSAGVRVTLPTIFGHRDVGTTACPGAFGYAQLPRVRDLVAERLPLYSNPRGSLDATVGGVNTAAVSGWAFDPDVPSESIEVHVHVDGRPVEALTANGRRADIAAAFPSAGAAHGYSTTLALSPGSHQVCAFGINRGAGANSLLGCRAVSVRAPDPVPKGSLDAITVFGSEASVAGWAVDEDRPATALEVHIYVDGRGARALVADAPRPDIGRAFPGAGADHGFAGVIPLGPGTHQVCAYAINVGAGSVNAQIGCRTVTVDAGSHSPVGAISATASGRTASITGWVVDPDAPTAAAPVHVYVGGRGSAVVSAGSVTTEARPLEIFGVDDEHGFSRSLTLKPGSHEVCAYGINTGAGANTLLGCRTVTIAAAAWNPEGSLDAATVDGRRVTVGGWAVDFDAQATPAAVHVHMDGRPLMAVAADATRTDIGRIFPGAGDRHGFRATFTVPAGTHSICAYAINVGEGTANTSLGCRTATVAAAAWNPEGTLDVAAVSGGRLTVGGWAFDPDVPTAPVQVHAYVDGVGRAIMVADGSRPDVGAAIPGIGPSHGFQATLPLTSGSHTVCLYAINVATGSGNTTLGCRTVTA